MSGLFSGYGRGARRLAIVLSAVAVDETAAQGTLVGTLTGPASGWTFRMADDAGGMFALDGNRLLVGAAPLSHDAAPAPKLLVAASDGVEATAEVLTLDVRRRLPALPLAAGSRLAAIGDSQVGYNNTFGGPVGNGGSNLSTRAAMSTGYGFIEQAEAHDQRFRFDNWYDPDDPRGLNYAGAGQGIHGDHLAWEQAGFGGGILGRLPALLARRPDIVIVQGGINSIASGDGSGTPVAASYVIERLDAALRLARRAGVWSVPMTIYPRGDWVGVYPDKIATVEAVNAWIRAQAGREGVLAVLDAEPLLASAGVQRPDMFKADKIHLSPRGALAVGREALLPILQGTVAAGSTFDKDPAVANLLPTAIYTMPGTTGTRQRNGLTNGTGSPTGQVATGYTLSTGRNAAVAASKEAVAGALESQVIAITPGGSDSGAYGEVTLSGMIAPEPATPGQWYQAYVEVETSGDGLTFAQFQGGLRDSANAFVTQTIALGRESSVDYAAGVGGGARTMWLKTEPFRAPEGMVYDKLGFSLLLTFSKTASPFVVKVRRPIVRRVVDPRPAWGY